MTKRHKLTLHKFNLITVGWFKISFVLSELDKILSLVPEDQAILFSKNIKDKQEEMEKILMVSYNGDMDAVIRRIRQPD